MASRTCRSTEAPDLPLRVVGGPDNLQPGEQSLAIPITVVANDRYYRRTWRRGRTSGRPDLMFRTPTRSSSMMYPLKSGPSRSTRSVIREWVRGNIAGTRSDSASGGRQLRMESHHRARYVRDRFGGGSESSDEITRSCHATASKRLHRGVRSRRRQPPRLGQVALEARRAWPRGERVAAVPVPRRSTAPKLMRRVPAPSTGSIGARRQARPSALPLDSIQ